MDLNDRIQESLPGKGSLPVEDLAAWAQRNKDELVRLADLVKSQPPQDIPTEEPVDLDGLINRLLEDFDLDAIGRRIESRFPEGFRPKAVLAATQSASEDTPYDDRALMSTALRYMFLIFAPQRAIVEACPLDDEEARKLLETFKIPPLDDQLVMPVCNASEAIRRICEIEEEVNGKLEQGLVNTAYLEEQTVRAWALVEDILRLSLAFFTLHFKDPLPPKFVQRVRQSVSKRAREEIVVLLREVEEVFQYGELLSEKEERDASNIGDDERRQIEQEKQGLAKHLRAECQRYFGRESPFKNVTLGYYNEWNGGNGDDLARYSLKRARELIQYLLDNHIVPKLAVIMGRGKDWYGNPVVWFAETESVVSDFQLHQEMIEWMYPDPNVRLIPFQQVAVLPARANPRELLIEPVIYPIEDVISMLETDDRVIDDTSIRTVSTSLSKKKAKRKHLTRLREILTKHFDKEELRTLCFDLDVDYDSLPAEGKAGKARELVNHFAMRGRITELVQIGEVWLPDISWEGTTGGE